VATPIAIFVARFMIDLHSLRLVVLQLPKFVAASVPIAPRECKPLVPVLYAAASKNRA
jgi:hypothetical protein